MYVNPYEKVNLQDGQWLRSNFHTHAGTGKGTCGHLEIEEVIETYKSAGYDVLTISNHDIYSDVREYESKYDITLLNGFEYSRDKHMLCIGGSDLIMDTHQNAINKCNAQGGFVILCHPNWIEKEYWPLNKIDALQGYVGIEIINPLIFRLSGSGLATDVWDYLLSQGKLVWGFGDDDFHRWFDMGKAWNMIYSARNHEDIKESIRSGSFYVSTGLILSSFTFDKAANTITVSATSKDTYVKNNRYIFIGKNGHVLDKMEGEFGEYQIKGDESYVRVQVVSEHGAMLWTQPVFKDTDFK